MKCLFGWVTLVLFGFILLVIGGWWIWKTAEQRGMLEAWEDAREAKIMRELACMRNAHSQENWDGAHKAALAVLAEDAHNSEAKCVCAEAESRWQATIRLTKASIGGARNVKAIVTEGLIPKGATLPQTVTVPQGGSYPFTLEYEENGQHYKETFIIRVKGGTSLSTSRLLTRLDPRWEKGQPVPKGLFAGDTIILALPGGAEMTMIWCPAGTFMMGSPEGEEGRDDDEILHPVTLTKGFWLAQTEVTQKQWTSVMEYNPSLHQGDRLPVENVSWSECMAFCEKTGLVLPTEAQWEYACRAGNESAYGGGWDENPWIEPREVKRLDPNAWGLYDMHGNVQEWCADWYGPYPNGETTNPIGPDSGTLRILRGGHFDDLFIPNYNGFLSSTRRNEQCRSAFRGVQAPFLHYDTQGFRPALPVQ